MPRKQRITVSLSLTSARFLRAFRTKERSPSMSALFENIVADLQNRVEMEQLEKKITDYYDALPETSVRGDYAWGALGETVLASEALQEKQESQPQFVGAGR